MNTLREMFVEPTPRLPVTAGDLARAVEQVAEGIVITDRNGTIRYVNPAFSRMTGFDAEEAIGQSPRLVRSGRQDRRFYENLWSTILSGRTWQGDLINRRKDGTFYTEEMTITPVRDCTEQITHFIAIKQDVTARRAAEEAQRFLASVVQLSEDAIVGTTLDGGVISWNPAAEKMYGFRAAEILGEPVTLTIPERYWGAFQTNLARIAKGETMAAFEGSAVARDGREFDISLSLSPIPGRHGEVIGNAAIIRDITARKQDERAKAFLASLVECSDDAILGMTPEGIILSWNKGAERVYGYSAEETIGRLVSILAADDRIAEIDSLLRTAREGRRVAHYETLRRRKDGTLVDISLSMGPICDSADDVVAIASIGHDITDRKRAEQDTARAAATAEAANRAKSEFLANMSHEIRTPMNGIIAMTDLVLETELNSEQREYLGIVKTSADSLLGIINDILDFSKVEAHKLDLERIAFDVRAVVESAVKSVSVPAREKGLELSCHIAPEVGCAAGDPQRLRQILLNVVSNAIKFTDRGRVDVEVAKESESAESISFHFRVRDTGIGIPPDKRQSIFQAFVQGDSSVTRRFGGTGLGLAISARLVEMMKGQIWVESEPGQGSEFHFRVCLARCP